MVAVAHARQAAAAARAGAAAAELFECLVTADDASAFARVRLLLDELAAVRQAGPQRQDE